MVENGPPAEGRKPARSPRQRVARMIVRQAMSRLDGRSRELCTQIAIEGRSYADVSASLSLPAGSVGPLYIRAKNKLRKALDC